MRTLKNYLTLSILLIWSLNSKASIISKLDANSDNMGIQIEDISDFSGAGAGITHTKNTLAGYDSWGTDCNAPTNSVCYINKKWHDISVPSGDSTFILTLSTGRVWERAAVVNGPVGAPSTVGIVNYGGSSPSVAFKGYVFEITNDNGNFDGVTSLGGCSYAYLDADQKSIRVTNKYEGPGYECQIHVVNVDPTMDTGLKIAQNDAQWRIREDFYTNVVPGEYMVTWPSNLANSDIISYQKPSQNKVTISNNIEWQFKINVVGYLEFILNDTSDRSVTLEPGKDHLLNIPFDLFTSFDKLKFSTDCLADCKLVNHSGTVNLPYTVGFSLSPNPSIPKFLLDQPVSVQYSDGLRYKELIKGNIFVIFDASSIDDVANDTSFDSSDIFTGSFNLYIEPDFR
jgi:hypothetical protein